MTSSQSFAVNELHTPHISISKDLSTNKLPRHNRTRVPVKSQLLSSSIYSNKDPVLTKPLPEVLKYEKKPIHCRSISKTRTLPYIKNAENDFDQITSKKRPENASIDCSTISIKKKVRISIRNVKIQSFFPKAKEKSPEIEIKISGCEDLIVSKMDSSLKSPKKLFVQSGVSLSSSPKPDSRRRQVGTTSASPVASIRKTLEKDPFYYLNYLKHINVTSFYHILDGVFDGTLNNLTYYSRVIKKNIRLQSEQKFYFQKTPKAKFSCTCCHPQNLTKSKAEVFKLKKLVKIVPGLYRIFLSPQPAEHPNNFMVFNFESVIGSFTNEIYILPGILKMILKLSMKFRIILTTCLEEEKLKEVVKFIGKQNIWLSGVYRLSFPAELNRELGKMLDYHQIYKDFGIEKPDKQVLIFGAHRISERIENCAEFIAIKRGLSKKLNIDR